MVLKTIPLGVGLPIADGVKFINDAIEAAEQAKIDSTTAKDSAEQTRVELDQAILSGDSSPLSGQLSVGSGAVTYPSAQERFLQERQVVTSQLAEKATKYELTTAVAPKANLSDVRLQSTKIKLIDADEEFISAISGGATINLESIPQNESVKPSKLASILQKYLFYGFSWGLGSVLSDGSLTPSTSRIRTPIFFAEKGTKIKLDDTINYKYAMHQYKMTDQSYIGQTGWITNISEVTENLYIILIVSKTTDSDLTDIEDSTGNHLIVYGADSVASEIKTEKLASESVTTEKIKKKSITPQKLSVNLQDYLFYGYEWELGSLNSSGQFLSNSSRIRTTDYQLMNVGTTVSLQDSKYQFAVHVYSVDKVFINQTGWIVDEYTVDTNTYHKFIVSLKDGSELGDKIQTTSEQLMVVGKKSLLIPTKEIILNPLNANVKAIAHRGYSLVAPEETEPAYRLAKQMGFSYVETDVQFTSDGVPVLCHDLTIDRTSNGTGNITDLTLAQLKTYDFGSWKSLEYAGTTILTFKEFITLCKKLSLHPYIEPKAVPESQMTELFNIVNFLGMKNNVTWIGALDFLTKISMLDASARLGRVTGAITDAGIASIVALKTGENEVFADLDKSTITQEISDKIMVAKIGLETWTINTIPYLNSVFDFGVSGITTDGMNIAEALSEN